MLLVAGSPLMVVITSSGRNPAVAAGPPGDTAWTNSPSGTRDWAAAAGGIGVVCTPKKAWVTRPVAMISSAMDLARSTGMAKPSPMPPAPDSPAGLGQMHGDANAPPDPAATRLAGRARHRRASRRHAPQLALAVDQGAAAVA